jgi:autotransporter-associated beta strand protein
LGNTTLIANNDHGAPATSTFDGVILDNGSVGNLVKAGTGTLTLTGANTYSGTTTVNGGTLLINGDQSAATGAVSVNNSGTTLGGTGTIGGAITVNSGAYLRGGTGGSATGTLTLANNVTLTSGSIIELALGPLGAHSTLASTGGGISFDPTQAFHFIDLGALPGAYDNIITGLASDPGTEGSWTITNAGWLGIFSFDGSNIDLTLTAVVPVPEPSTWIGGGLACLTIAFSQRWRFRRWRGQSSRSI